MNQFAETKELEEWVARCLALSEEELAAEVLAVEQQELGWKRYELAVERGELYMEQDEEYVGLFDHTSIETRGTVAKVLLTQLHTRFKDHPLEGRAWCNVVDNITHSLPDEITHYLIDHDIAVVGLGHIPQSEAVLRRLAPLVDEALLTLVGNIYQDPQRSVEEFVEIFDQYPTHVWLLQHLAHSIASSEEKEAAFLQRVEGRKEWQVPKISERPGNVGYMNYERNLQSRRGECKGRVWLRVRLRFVSF